MDACEFLEQLLLSKKFVQEMQIQSLEKIDEEIQYFEAQEAALQQVGAIQ